MCMEFAPKQSIDNLPDAFRLIVELRELFSPGMNIATDQTFIWTWFLRAISIRTCHSITTTIDILIMT